MGETYGIIAGIIMIALIVIIGYKFIYGKEFTEE